METYPNILMIVLDDSNPQYFNHPAVPTPNITRIMTKGATFLNGASPIGVCRPVLASLINGRSPEQHGVLRNTHARGLAPSEFDLPRRLKKLGYETFLGGKFFEELQTEIPADERHTPTDYGFTKTEKYGRQNVIAEVPNPFVRAGQEEFLAMCVLPKPWFAYWAPLLPHDPYDAAPEYTALVVPGEIEVPAWVDPGDVAAFTALMEGYLACLAWVDDAIGDVLTALESVDALERTLIILVNDDGLRHDIISKNSPYNAAVATPISFYWKGVIRAGDRTDPMLSQQIVHTIADFCGVRRDDETGSVMDSLLDPFGGDRSNNNIICGSAYAAPFPGDPNTVTRTAVWARNKRWRYIQWLAPISAARAADLIWQGVTYNPEDGYPDIVPGTEYLFDLDADPDETTDVSGVADNARILAQLRTAADSWAKTNGLFTA